jgi:hypothetical protein
MGGEVPGSGLHVGCLSDRGRTGFSLAESRNSITLKLVKKGLQPVLLCGAAFVLSLLSLPFTILLVPHSPWVRWALLPEFGLMFGFAYAAFRFLQKMVPSPTAEQRRKGIRATKRLAWFYLIAPVVAYLVQWRELTALPHGLGYALPIFPVSLAVYYFRLSKRLSRESSSPERPT